jgi:hypothetical protein
MAAKLPCRCLSPVAERSAEGLAEPAGRWLFIGAMINQQQLDEAWQEPREPPRGVQKLGRVR